MTTLEEVRNNLIRGLESNYDENDIRFIDIRLEEIMDMERFSLEDLDYYCSLNSDEMFGCIFSYVPFEKERFVC